MHNHLAFTVRYHRDVQTDSARIVGFEVKPYRFASCPQVELSLVPPCSFVLIVLPLICSIKHEYDGKWSEKTRLTTCDPHTKRLVVSSSTPQEVEPKKEIIFTYDVDFQASFLHRKYF